MATGGAGDVLTGMIAALMGQNMSAYEAAVLGVYLHGRAGELAGRRLGMLSISAADMVDAVAGAIRHHRGA
jgi:NAD(P)H-hydrate epimerase